MKRTVTHLADGRELIYFDERDDATRDAADRRDLPPPPPASEMRHDPVLDEWVAIATHRQTRTFLPPSDQCPLCPSTPEWQSEIPSAEYDVVVFENRFPSFSHRVGPARGDLLPGLVPTRPAAGRCEVVCFTSDHEASFASLSPDRVRTVVEAWADRTADLNTRDDVEQVFCFENRGEEIGVTLHHPHGQIYAYPFVTPRTHRMLRSARSHSGGNLFAGLLAAERADGTRVVAFNEHWTAFVPATARWPFEIHLYPHRQVPDIPALSGAERDAFGPLYLETLRRLDGLFGLPMPYISAWHQAPARVDRDLAYLHLRVFSTRRAPGRLKYLAGSESGMGVFVNDVRPEQAAEMLQGVRL
ncbi:galactose-1-phosphate uridylyltransferase [Dactylosporangium roseum]|uniref:Galactose-1-phosphate uridylyltransferase n=1 Tax=Dactylosporangium roseum TaxID=47989 RepID=A0ABY5Z1T7_9ACTN|nr:galactose-1-phosphate uridylyltransferase [Dactylosporangium roseum]UWZ35422.1 galactose-1-phosphate uridylyltransferase [Dactylosporangium roseum]